jgi:hypothetical protein
MSKTYLVGFYEVDRVYGGPEEGGWYYDSGKLIRVFFVTKSRKEASKKAVKANSLLNVLQRNKTEVSSVLYRGGRHEALIFTNLAPSYFPEEIPHYE